MQVERWLDNEELESLVAAIEDNLGENGIALPY
jgi:hypothetical protein